MSGVVTMKKLGTPPHQKEYAESEGESSTTSTTYQNKVTLTFTAKTKDYIVYYSAEVVGSTPSGRCDVRFYDGTTVQGNAIPDFQQPYYTTFAGIKRLSLTAGSVTLTIDFRADNATAYIRKARLFVEEV